MNRILFTCLAFCLLSLPAPAQEVAEGVNYLRLAEPQSVQTG